ncbi:unnamed protein product [Nezara viridula]|nr:unnamed protein product [Nezara viridula]
MLRRRRKERKFLMDRLDMHRDNWRNIPLSLKLEDTSEQSAASKPAIFKLSKGNASGEKHKKIIKKKIHKVDKNAPKRPANPYFQFCQEQRTSTIEEMTSAGQSEPSKIDVTKHLAYKWNLLTQDDKKVILLLLLSLQLSGESSLPATSTAIPLDLLPLPSSSLHPRWTMHPPPAHRPTTLSACQFSSLTVRLSLCLRPLYVSKSLENPPPT